jgi:subtilisin family serine protease
MARKRRIAELTARQPPAPSSIFGPDDDNVIPGEVIVALEADSAADLTTSIPNVPGRGGRAEVAVTSFGATGLDKVLAGINVQSVERIHGASPTRVVDGLAMADDFGLDGTFRVRYAAADKPATVAGRLEKLGEVAWAEPNRWREAFLVPNDPQFGTQWGLTQINCPEAWDHTIGDPSIVVAVVDTGIDLNHPDLAVLVVAGQDLVDFPPGSIPKPGWVFEGDFTGVDANPQDEVGHGTHVAGTICAVSNNGVGVAGVAWNVRLMPVRVLARIRETATGRISGSGSAANIAAGIRWATDHGARVINMSLGGYGDTTVEREAVAYAIAHGVVVVAAMGNDDTTTPSFPAAYPDVIAVAATDSADHRASFSNRGPHIDVSGPGVGIVSTYWDDTYATLAGTSMASPHVAGVAALVLSRNTALTAAQVGNIIRTTAKPLKDNPADPVPNDSYGYGLVQAGAAVKAAAPIVKTFQIVCQKSFINICVTQGISCQKTLFCPSQTLVCQISQRWICPSEQILCQRSIGSLCQVSLADCPSLPCPLKSVACQLSLACGRFEPGRPGLPGRSGGPGVGEVAEEWEGYDPYGYDPYGSSYE